MADKSSKRLYRLYNYWNILSTMQVKGINGHTWQAHVPTHTRRGASNQFCPLCRFRFRFQSNGLDDWKWENNELFIGKIF